MGKSNVRTMIPGFRDNPQYISDTRKTAVIDFEPSSLQMDIVTLQETRLPGFSSVREWNFTFFWQENSLDKAREHGACFAVKNSLLESTVPSTEEIERILTLQIHTAPGPVTLMSTYALTLSPPQMRNTNSMMTLAPPSETFLTHGRSSSSEILTPEWATTARLGLPSWVT